MRTLLASASCAVLVSATPLSYSFTLLDHPPYSQVAVGNVLSWPDEGGGHRALTYAISDQLLPGESPEIRAAAVQAILDSLNTWSWGTCGYLTFTDAGYSPVENHDSTPKVQFEGPSIEEWIAMGQPLEMPFGWGANVDIFSKPRGYTMISNGVEYRMRQGILGFTAIHRNGNRIESVDIYLNENFDWTTIIPEDPEDDDDADEDASFARRGGGHVQERFLRSASSRARNLISISSSAAKSSSERSTSS